MNNKLVGTWKEVKAYITTNRNDDCGAWEYGHTPYLTNVLGNLNETESEHFSEELLSWSEFHLYELADPIIFCSNKYLNADLLYIKIFTKVRNIEYLDYLVENVIHSIRPPYYTHENIKDWDTEDILGLKENISKVKEVKGNGWKSLVEVIDFLEKELIRRKNTTANDFA